MKIMNNAILFIASSWSFIFGMLILFLNYFILAIPLFIISGIFFYKSFFPLKELDLKENKK